MRRMTSMTREEQIAVASCAYGMRGSSIDFEAGAKWADANQKSPWISVDDDLPCNHEELICEVCKGVEYETNRVLVLLIDGTIEISYMYHRMPYAWSWNTYKVTHWMPLPELPKE